jgi:Holliday junction resolvase RusA-like endonuclease
VEVFVFLAIPTSWSKRKHAAALVGQVFPTKKPDLDNFLKAILDGMNGIAFTDDARVVALISSKRYSDTPRVVVDLLVLDGECA